MKYLLDTNAIVNFVCDTGDYSIFKESDRFYVSFIVLIELSVGFKTEEEESAVKTFLDKIDTIMIDEELVESTIDIRKKTGLKLPDSIIAATALNEKATLVTSDLQMIKKADDLNITTYNPLQE